MKVIYLLILFASLIVFLPNCSKEEEYAFGETETDFVVDSVYKTNSAGFLSVDLYADWNNFSLSVYADKTPDPEKRIAIIQWHGSITQPLEKDTYWKVSYNNSEEYLRRLERKWTHIQ